MGDPGRMSHWENSGTPAGPATSDPAGGSAGTDAAAPDPAAAPAADLMPRLHDQSGRPIDFATYIQLHLDNPQYEYVESGRIGQYWVSTLWFGIDAGSVPRPRQPGSRRAPALYRTLIERLEDDAPDPEVFGLTPDTLRYGSEADARAGHAHVVQTLDDVAHSTAERPAVPAAQA